MKCSPPPEKRGPDVQASPCHRRNWLILDGALVATGFAYDAGLRATQAQTLTRLLPLCRDIRCMGSAALNLCWVGCGRLDAYFERDLKVYDYARRCSCRPRGRSQDQASLHRRPQPDHGSHRRHIRLASSDSGQPQRLTPPASRSSSDEVSPPSPPPCHRGQQRRFVGLGLLGQPAGRHD